MLRHFQMQRLAGVRMGQRNLFVQFHAQAGVLARDHIAVFPLDLLFQQPFVKAAELLDALQDQEVRDAGGQLDVGCGLDRAAIQVRRDLGIVGLGHAGDLLAFQDAADPSQRGLQNAGRTGLEHAGEFVFGAQTLTGGHRDAGVACHLGHHLGALGRGGFLKPQRVVLFQPACQPFGA